MQLTGILHICKKIYANKQILGNWIILIDWNRVLSRFNNISVISRLRRQVARSTPHLHRDKNMRYWSRNLNPDQNTRVTDILDLNLSRTWTDVHIHHLWCIYPSVKALKVQPFGSLLLYHARLRQWLPFFLPVDQARATLSSISTLTKLTCPRTTWGLKWFWSFPKIKQTWN